MGTRWWRARIIWKPFTHMASSLFSLLAETSTGLPARTSTVGFFIRSVDKDCLGFLTRWSWVLRVTSRKSKAKVHTIFVILPGKSQGIFSPYPVGQGLPKICQGSRERDISPLPPLNRRSHILRTCG